MGHPYRQRHADGDHTHKPDKKAKAAAPKKAAPAKPTKDTRKQ